METRTKPTTKRHYTYLRSQKAEKPKSQEAQQLGSSKANNLLRVRWLNPPARFETKPKLSPRGARPGAVPQLQHVGQVGGHDHGGAGVGALQQGVPPPLRFGRLGAARRKKRGGGGIKRGEAKPRKISLSCFLLICFWGVPDYGTPSNAWSIILPLRLP